MPSVTRSVSASCDPGGSSSASSVRPASSAGRNPEGSSEVEKIEAANSAMPVISVIQRWRTDQRTSPV